MSHLHPHRSDDDQIFQKYLDRAISEINDLSKEISECETCDGERDFSPVVGTGHPLADIFLLKFQPRDSEAKAGVAFYGEAGDAVLRSVQRLNVDPLDLYGTNCIKCCVGEPRDHVSQKCPAWLRQEVSIVCPQLMVVMGEPAMDVVNSLEIEGSRALEWKPGRRQQWTHTCEALVCPDIDDSLATPSSKREFWSAFREVGSWYYDRPPY